MGGIATSQYSRLRAKRKHQTQFLLIPTASECEQAQVELRANASKRRRWPERKEGVRHLTEAQCQQAEHG